jgi:hypothetical protein
VAKWTFISFFGSFGRQSLPILPVATRIPAEAAAAGTAKRSLANRKK